MCAPDPRGRRHAPAERGFALAAALFALLVVGALAAAALFAALQEARLGRNGRAAEVASAAAESGLNAALADGRMGAWGSLDVGDSLVSSGTADGGAGNFSVSVLRLSGRLFLIRSTGADAGGGSEQRMGVLARRVAAGAPAAAALVAGGPVEIGAATVLDGRDADPPGWSGCPGALRDSVAGLALPAATDLVTGAGCAGGACLRGEPPLLEDPSLRDSVPVRLGAGDRAALARLASVVLPAGGTPAAVTPAPVGGADSCDRAAAFNWGEPERPAAVAGCTGYFPVVLAEGDLTLVGGRGQGILVVEGDLTVAGGATWAGAVLVGGAVRFSGAGGRVFGGVSAGPRGGASVASLEGASVAYSSCALAAAGASAGPVRALPERSWAYLF